MEKVKIGDAIRIIRMDDDGAGTHRLPAMPERPARWSTSTP